MKLKLNFQKTEYHHDTGTGKDFFNRRQKSLTTEEKNR